MVPLTAKKKYIEVSFEAEARSNKYAKVLFLRLLHLSSPRKHIHAPRE